MLVIGTVSFHRVYVARYRAGVIRTLISDFGCGVDRTLPEARRGTRPSTPHGGRLLGILRQISADMREVVLCVSGANFSVASLRMAARGIKRSSVMQTDDTRARTAMTSMVC